MNSDDRFWSKVNRRGSDDCWEWMGKPDKDGYGKFRVGGKGSPTVRAHRHAWEQANGPMSNDKLACHTCDNPACCNPAHIYAGTPLSNTRDMIVRGRAAFGDRNASRLYPERLMRGEQVNTATITEAQAIAIMARWLQIGNQSQVARELGVSLCAVGRLVRGETWKHLFQPERAI